MSTTLLSLFIWRLSLVAAVSWGFDDATVSVHGKKAGVGGGLKEKLFTPTFVGLCNANTIRSRLMENKALAKPVLLGPTDTLKIILTATEDKQAKRPHQAFILLREPKSNLDTSFPLSVKESGKGKIELVRSSNAGSTPDC